jgi:hypothetical protein
MWLQNANYFGQTMSWQEAKEAVEELEFAGYNDWRLPLSDEWCTRKNCRESEMGHLFYEEGITAKSPEPFFNVRPYYYWSATEYNTEGAWRFNFKYGTQGVSNKMLRRYVWPVRVVPEPTSSLLFISGGGILLLRKIFKKNKK